MGEWEFEVVSGLELVNVAAVSGSSYGDTRRRNSKWRGLYIYVELFSDVDEWEFEVVLGADSVVGKSGGSQRQKMQEGQKDVR